MGGTKNKWGSNTYYYITKFHYSISLETASTQNSEVFLLRISLENVIASVVTCWYPQIYNFRFRKEVLETISKCICLEF